MIINENVNMSGAVINEDKQIISLNSNLDSNCVNFGLNITIMDKQSTSDNVLEAQRQIDEFLLAVRDKMIELGYKITI